MVLSEGPRYNSPPPSFNVLVEPKATAIKSGNSERSQGTRNPRLAPLGTSRLSYTRQQQTLLCEMVETPSPPYNCNLAVISRLRDDNTPAACGRVAGL